MKAILPLLGLLALLPLVARAEAPSFKARLIPEFHIPRETSPFAPGLSLTDLGQDFTREEVEGRWSWRGLGVVATAAARQGREVKEEVIVNEFHYQGSLLGQRFSLGKKILSWDVGFGFRPLDVIQQENRRRLYPTTLEGIPHLAWESYTADAAWTLVLANPGRGREVAPRDDPSLALKYYRHADGTDFHGVLRSSRRQGLEGGAAFSRVENEGLEWHGSLLLQEHYEKTLNPLAAAPGPPLATRDPLVTRRRVGGAKALLGGSWTTAEGYSLLVEAWYDRSAPSAQEWRALAALARRQGAVAAPPGAVAGNLAWSLRYFEAPNLLPGNVLLRLARRPEGSSVEGALELLHTPADGGRVITFSLAHEADRYRLDAGLRFYGGPPDAAYRLLPESRAAYLALQAAF